MWNAVRVEGGERGAQQRANARADRTVGRRRTHIRSVAFFGHDSGETVINKRVKAFQAAGADVSGFMFHRERRKDQAAPSWRNFALGTTVDRNYLARLPKLVAALWKVWPHRELLRACDVIYARNIDMMAIAAAAKWLSGSSAPLVYEVLDVQRVFVGQGVVNKFFRWCERRLLAMTDMLVVSSPFFMTKYFEPIQGYMGDWYLLENKVSAALLAASPRPMAISPASGPPWIIGWFGTIRCQRSLEILSRLAAARPELVSVHVRGLLSQEDISQEAMAAAMEGRPNLQYFGPYQNPRDLADIYGQIHFTWAIDFLDAGSNSDWLLPNRIYEGGLYNAISIARDATATGDMVNRNKLGIVLSEPIDEPFLQWLEAMDAHAYQDLRQSAGSASRALFIDEEDTAQLLEILGKKRTGYAQPNTG